MCLIYVQTAARLGVVRGQLIVALTDLSLLNPLKHDILFVFFLGAVLANITTLRLLKLPWVIWVNLSMITGVLGQGAEVEIGVRMVKEEHAQGGRG